MQISRNLPVSFSDALKLLSGARIQLKNSSQSSKVDNINIGPKRLIDKDIETSSCTTSEANPWFAVEFEPTVVQQIALFVFQVSGTHVRKDDHILVTSATPNSFTKVLLMSEF